MMSCILDEGSEAGWFRGGVLDIIYIHVSFCLLYNLRAHETKANLVCRLLLEKKKK